MKPVCLLFLLSFSLAEAQDKRLYELPMGKHAIGFKTIQVLDLSRSPIYHSDFFGKLSKPQNNAGRQINISIWYPAVKGVREMRWKDYVAELGRPADSEKNAFVQGLELYLESLNDLRQDSLPLKDLEILHTLRANAYKNADHAKGSFPLLLFPCHRTPTHIIILSEYLASHGFVVASTDLYGVESDIPDISAQGLQALTLDLLAATNLLRKQPFVDSGKLAAMGLGFNATTAFSLRTISSEVDALISLEGGILSDFEMQMLRKSVFYDPIKFNCPALFIHAPHPAIDPKKVDELKYGDKHFIYFPKMTEHYFLDYGILEQYIPGIIGKAPGDTRKGFELAADFVLQFLEYTLNNNAEARQKIKSSTVDPLYSSLEVTKNFIPALPPIPSLTQLKDLIAREGIAGYTAVLEKSMRAGDKQPFSQQYLLDLQNWLAYKRDPDFTSRKVIAESRVALYPTFTRAHFSLANIYFQLKEKEKAIRHYNQALSLIQGDQDPDLTVSLRERIHAGSLENLKKLQEM